MSLFIPARSILTGSRAIAGLGYVKAHTEHLIVRRWPRGMRDGEEPRLGEEGMGCLARSGGGRKMGCFFLHVLGREKYVSSFLVYFLCPQNTRL